MAKPYKIKEYEGQAYGQTIDQGTVRAFIKENNFKTVGDTQQALKELFKDTIQEMLEAELEADLSYS